jgi:poly(3-hydroxybutyrate) depolymerase
MTITDYKRRGGQPVARLVEVDSLGHAWSGGAPSKPYSDSRGPDASKMAWSFVVSQFKREPNVEATAVTRGWPPRAA